MKSEKINFILGCLNANIDKRILGQIKPDQWQGILGLVRKKQISALVFSNLKKLNLLSAIPSFVQKMLENEYYSNFSQNVYALGKLKTLLEKLNLLGVKPIILKGMALVNTVYNDNLALRPMVDVDILIHPEQLNLLNSCLKDLGYKITAYGFGSWDCYSQDHEHPETQETFNLEIHWHILHRKFNRILNIDESKFWQRAINFKIEDADCLILSPEDNIFYLSLHLTLLHFFANIIWLYDIKKICETYKDKISWDKLWEVTDRAGATSTVYYCLRFTKDILDAPLDENIIERFSPAKLRKMIIACFLKPDYILADRDLAWLSYIVRPLMFNRLKDIFRLLLINILPDKEELKYRYPAKGYLSARLAYALRPIRIFLRLILVLKKRETIN